MSSDARVFKKCSPNHLHICTLEHSSIRATRHVQYGEVILECELAGPTAGWGGTLWVRVDNEEWVGVVEERRKVSFLEIACNLRQSSLGCQGLGRSHTTKWHECLRGSDTCALRDPIRDLI